MDNLILVRHGNYNDNNGHINEYGQRQMKSLAANIMPLVQNKRVMVLSSSALRAKDSAAILCKELNESNLAIDEILWSESSHPENLPAALDLIRSYISEKDIIIVVTHLEYTDYFPYYFGINQLGVKFSPIKNIGKGKGVNIDCNKKTQSYI